MTTVTPSLGMRGLWFVLAPFAVESGTIYNCSSIRSFRDYRLQGGDVFKEIYQPVGLTEEDLAADIRLNAVLVTLESDNAPMVVVPSSYIERYPELNYVTYGRLLVSLDLGPLPTTVDLTHLKTELSGVTQAYSGVEPVVRLHLIPGTTVLTKTESEAVETARRAAVTADDSIYARYQRALAIIDRQKEQNDALMMIIQEAGLLAE